MDTTATKTHPEMITLNSAASSIYEVFISRPHDVIDAARKALIKEMSQDVTYMLESQKIIQRVHDCKSQQDIEKFEYVMFDSRLIEKLQERVNGLEEFKPFTEQETGYIMLLVLDKVAESAHAWVQSVLRQRMERLAKESKSRIILS